MSAELVNQMNRLPSLISRCCANSSAIATTMTITVKPMLEQGWRLTTLDGEDVTGGVTIDPFGISVFSMTKAG